ncbi:MAG: hypothetical protein L3J04_10255 [Robiginitomaculum sp.]|nr:hypothetical protein [Robiginitomaculum sp.]
MKRYNFIPIAALSLIVAACGGGAGFDRKDPPAGGTKVEMAFQTAIRQADQGYCASAMPVFVCLASQGNGWEVAATRAGKCAPIAAKLSQQADEDADPGHDFAWQSSPDKILAEGLRQYRRAANANWPQAQAALAIQLYEDGGNSYAEARHWMERYDINPRRKIYGGNVIPISMRKHLSTIAKTGAGGVMWTPIPFAAENLHNSSCNALIGKGHGSSRQGSAEIEDDDGIVKTKPRKTHEDSDTQPRGTGGHGEH